MAAAAAPGTSDGRVYFPPSNVNVLLLEKVHAKAVQQMREQGFNVKEVSKGLTEEELVEAIRDVHILGVRSKTKVTKAALEAGKRLLTIGCFCIGTDQVDLPEASKRGVAVFNSPYGNTRSVSELVLAEIIMLARRAGDRSMEMHRGEWNKVSDGCFEVRGKKLGIVGYGHVGSQLSVLAEALGMRVIFYDIIPKLSLGTATAMSSLEEVLQKADFVSLHVPADKTTTNMISKPQLDLMKPGSYLINASRGNVVDINALAEALRSGHIAGSAVDVFPEEPAGAVKDFKTPLQGCPNTLMTPHVGGSTEEAQAAIGIEVANKLIDFVNRGSTMGSVNVPEVAVVKQLPAGHTRVLSFHKNTPGVLREINQILSVANISSQTLETGFNIGYLVVDLESETSDDINKMLNEMTHNIRTRVLYCGKGYQGGPI